jgi:malonyl-ACP decarboxylase
VSYSARVALITLAEAWNDAKLDGVDPARVGLIVAGSNFQQRELVQTYDAYRTRLEFLRPTFGFSFLDSDVCGVCTEAFPITGLACTLGTASASGQSAILWAANAIRARQVDVCIVVGALMDVSYWECQAFSALGAMGSRRFAGEPGAACRPFDRDRDGFIYGESCAAVVVEHGQSLRARKARSRAVLSAVATRLDRNRNPNPSLIGEIAVIAEALEVAGLGAAAIDYVNPHATGSELGDTTELQALAECGLNDGFINTTKSITGHGLCAAGVVEVVATLLQLEAGELHPCLNLDHPLRADFNFVGATKVAHTIRNALCLSIGFGGCNTALIAQRP